MRCNAQRFMSIVSRTAVAAFFALALSGPAVAEEDVPDPRIAAGERERLIGLFQNQGAEAAPQLAEALDMEPAFLGRTAAHLLVRLGPPAIDGIERALRHDDHHIRGIAIHGLADMGLLLDYWQDIAAEDHPAIRREVEKLYVLDEQLASPPGFLDGPVLRFNGESAFVEAQERVNVGAGNFTYELWFKPAELPSDDPFGLMGKGRGDTVDRRGVNFRYDPEGVLHFRAANNKDNIRLSHEVGAKGRWLHAAATVDRQGQARLYLNGLLVGETDATGFEDDDGFDAGPFRVGRRPYTDIWHFRGAAGALRVWQTARTQEEILDDMRRALTGDEQDLVLCWPMNDGQGDAVRDQSPRQNHGRIVDGAWE